MSISSNLLEYLFSMSQTCYVTMAVWVISGINTPVSAVYSVHITIVKKVLRQKPKTKQKVSVESLSYSDSHAIEFSPVKVFC